MAKERATTKQSPLPFLLHLLPFPAHSGQEERRHLLTPFLSPPLAGGLRVHSFFILLPLLFSPPVFYYGERTTFLKRNPSPGHPKDQKKLVKRHYNIVQRKETGKYTQDPRFATPTFVPNLSPRTHPVFKSYPRQTTPIPTHTTVTPPSHHLPSHPHLRPTTPVMFVCRLSPSGGAKLVDAASPPACLGKGRHLPPAYLRVNLRRHPKHMVAMWSVYNPW